MAERQDNTNEFNLLKVGPWFLLVALLLTIIYMWPWVDRAGEKIGTKAKVEKSAAGKPGALPKENKVQEGLRAEILDMINFRSKPDLSDATVIAVVKKGTSVKVIERQPKWLKIELDDGRIGFVTSNPKYVRVIEQSN